MKQKTFRYLSYQENLAERLLDYRKDSYIVVENNQIKSILMSQYYHFPILEERPIIFSLEELFSYLFVSSHAILKDVKRIFFLYRCLSKEMKNAWQIQSYFDFVDIANEFFMLYEEIQGKEAELETMISAWQKEKYNFFKELKERLEKKQGKYLLKEFAWTKERYSPQNLHHFSKIVFFDIPSFPNRCKTLLPLLQEDFDLEFVLQVPREDFEEEKLMLRQVSPKLWEGDFFCYEVGSEWEEALYLLTEKEKKDFFVYSSSPHEKHFSSLFPQSFIDSSRNSFNKTKLYQFIELQLNLLREKEVGQKDTLPLEALLSAVQKRICREYYGFWEEDFILLRKLLKEEYRLISIKLLQNTNYIKIIGEHPSFYQKVSIFLEDLFAIETWKTGKDIYDYFEQHIEIQKWKEEEYPDVLDVFYEVLSRLYANQESADFPSYDKYFEGNLGRNLYQLLYRSLDSIYLKSAQSFSEEKMEIRDWHSVMYEKKKERAAVFLNLDDKSLPKITNFSHFLTEHQKQQLGCQSREESTLVEKYRFYQALYSQKSLVFLVQKSEEDNKTLSSFVEEFLRNQGKTMEKSPYSKEFFLQSLRESFQAKSSWQGEEEIGYRELKKENEELLQEGNFCLGAYDWRNLQACTKYFYFSRVLQEPFRTETLSFGISPKQLGIICHRFLEKIGKTQWKIFLKEKHFAISDDTLVEYLEEEFQREALRIPSFLKNYLEKIVYPRILKNTKSFLHTIEKKYHQENISRFQGEKGIQREGIYFGKNFTVSFQGRADLIIETDQRKEIIDYKTGKTIEDQLDFYAFLLYGEEENVEGRYFNLWDGIFSSAKKKEDLSFSFFEEYFESFEKDEFYHISEKKSFCIYCPYQKICRREEEVL
ncbi:MAG: PD-(D/E)XK nuclease family protein [Fusobacterium necrophorum]|nr:PD-(D/E)XK nuclease family protein [Fusobacterium necrophorum]